MNGVALSDGHATPGHTATKLTSPSVVNDDAGEYLNGDNFEQRNLVFPNENPTVFVERREDSADSVHELGKGISLLYGCGKKVDETFFCGTV